MASSSFFFLSTYNSSKTIASTFVLSDSLINLTSFGYPNGCIIKTYGYVLIMIPFFYISYLKLIVFFHQVKKLNTTIAVLHLVVFHLLITFLGVRYCYTHKHTHTHKVRVYENLKSSFWILLLSSFSPFCFVPQKLSIKPKCIINYLITSGFFVFVSSSFFFMLLRTL